MALYSLLRPLLFTLDPERAHGLALRAMDLLHGCHLWPAAKVPHRPTRCGSMVWPNPLGLAAGLDKNADYIECLALIGFGAIEVGTVTPKPQPGNPKPRLFRLSEDQAIINRMGFNNKGVDYLVRRVEQSDYQGILGINIGKNAVTPVEAALGDYQTCLEAVYPLADYITVNISSPNTQGLRDLQHGEALGHLLAGLKTTQAACRARWGRQVPLWVKVAPDLTKADCEFMAGMMMSHDVEGVIVSNTTLQRPGLKATPLAHEQGGLSGQPLTDLAHQALLHWRSALSPEVTLIGVGGIATAKQAQARLDAGATCLQLYTALIHDGPACVKQILDGMPT